MPENRPRFVLWTPAQRRGVTVITVVVLLVAIVRLASNRQFVPDPQPLEPARAAELADRIDPNTADAATLSVLPMIGPKRAAEIVAFRESALARRPDRPPFRSAADLLAIRGFGATTVRQLEPYLLFPATQPASASPSPGAGSDG
jgi:DNA uptake protein ComE-like DNA-binding protein